MGNVNAQPGGQDTKTNRRQSQFGAPREEALIRRLHDSHPRISCKCLWTLNQYGSRPKKNRNTASPKSMSPDITDTANQISPADSLTRPCNGKLETGANRRANTGAGCSQNLPKEEIWVRTRRDVHYTRFLTELDEREGRESGRAHCDERTVCLVAIQEPRLERKAFWIRDGRK